MTDLTHIHRLSVGAMTLIDEIDRLATAAPPRSLNDLCVHPRDAFPVDDRPIKINCNDLFAKTPTRPALPRPISSLEELENLPTKAVVLDRDGDAWQKLSGGNYYHTVGVDHYSVAKDVFEECAPFTLIYQPEDNE